MQSAICGMSNFFEQRNAVKFCFRKYISAAETYRMLQKAFGGILFGSVQTILKNHLGLRKVKSRLVPKFLNLFEKRRVQAMVSDYQGVYK